MSTNNDISTTKSIPHKKNIDYRFKLLYALGMVLIVAGHCENGGFSLLYEWFPAYSFHLALFVFCSGYFYSNKSEENIPKYFVKKVKSLLIPLFAWNFLYGILVTISHKFGFTIGGDFTLFNLFVAPLTHAHHYLYNLSGWFVVPLFITEIFNVLFRKAFTIVKHSFKEHLLFAIYLALGCLGVYLSNEGYTTDWWLTLTRPLVFLPFFALGYLYKCKLEKFDKLPNIVYFPIVCAIQLIIIVVTKTTPTYTMVWGKYEGILQPFVLGTLGIAFWLRVCKILEPVLGRSKYINLIADNTYSIMINHIGAFMVVKLVFGLISKFTPLFSTFSFYDFKTDIWYFYKPNDMNQTMIIYLIAGIVIPIFMQKAIDFLKKQLLSFKNK